MNLIKALESYISSPAPPGSGTTVNPSPSPDSTQTHPSSAFPAKSRTFIYVPSSSLSPSSSSTDPAGDKQARLPLPTNPSSSPHYDHEQVVAAALEAFQQAPLNPPSSQNSASYPTSISLAPSSSGLPYRPHLPTTRTFLSFHITATSFPDNDGSHNPAPSINVPLLVGLISGFGTLFFGILCGVLWFALLGRGRVKLGPGNPGEYDDEHAALEEEIAELEAMDETTRQTYLRTKAYVASNPPNSAHSEISLAQYLTIQEKGVSAWEFEVDFPNSNCFVEGRTEIEFYDNSICSTQTNLPIPKQNDVYYWEAKMFDMAPSTLVSVGLTTKPYPTFRLPGFTKFSVAYDSRGTRRINNSNAATLNFGPKYQQGDVVGVGYRPRTGTVFFTHNGRRVDDAAVQGFRFNLFPTVGADGPCKVTVNFGQAGFVYIEANVKKWGLAPATGTLSPPPPYGAERDSVLLETGMYMPSGSSAVSPPSTSGGSAGNGLAGCSSSATGSTASGPLDYYAAQASHASHTSSTSHVSNDSECTSSTITNTNAYPTPASLNTTAGPVYAAQAHNLPSSSPPLPPPPQDSLPRTQQAQVQASQSPTLHDEQQHQSSLPYISPPPFSPTVDESPQNTSSYSLVRLQSHSVSPIEAPRSPPPSYQSDTEDYARETTTASSEVIQQVEEALEHAEETATTASSGTIEPEEASEHVEETDSAPLHPQEEVTAPAPAPAPAPEPTTAPAEVTQESAEAASTPVEESLPSPQEETAQEETAEDEPLLPSAPGSSSSNTDATSSTSSASKNSKKKHPAKKHKSHKQRRR